MRTASIRRWIWTTPRATATACSTRLVGLAAAMLSSGPSEERHTPQLAAAAAAVEAGAAREERAAMEVKLAELGEQGVQGPGAVATGPPLHHLT